MPIPTRLRSLAPFGLVFALALAVRLAYLWSWHETALFTTPIGDARAYLAWARELAAGDWIGHEVFYQAPLYPYFLAACCIRCSVTARGSRGSCRRLLGALACALLGLAGARFFRPARRARRGARARALRAGDLLRRADPEGGARRAVLVSALLLALAGRVDRDRPWVARSRPARCSGCSRSSRENALVLAPLAAVFVALAGSGAPGAAARARGRARSRSGSRCRSCRSACATRRSAGASWSRPRSSGRTSGSAITRARPAATSRCGPAAATRASSARTRARWPSRRSAARSRRPRSPTTGATARSPSCASSRASGCACSRASGRWSGTRASCPTPRASTRTPSDSPLLRALYALFGFGVLAPLALVGVARDAARLAPALGALGVGARCSRRASRSSTSSRATATRSCRC